MQALLSFDRAPPFAAPLRFFLTAPVFGVLAGLLIMVAGPDALSSRWMPAALAATHLVTVGFMLQVMTGALIQILPVVAGANLASPLGAARIVHGGLSAGGLVLATAFLLQSPQGFLAAAVILGVTTVVFLAAAGKALFLVPSTSPTIRGLKLALVGLAGTVCLGISLALALAKGWSLGGPATVDLHAAWALGAWSGILLVSMAYVVVPMFQLTPPYAARLSWGLPVVIIMVMVLWGLAVLAGAALPIRLAEAASALVGMYFAVLTLRLQKRRRRARFDATFRYWQGGLWCVVAAMVMALLTAIWPELHHRAAWPVLFGIVLGVGGFMSLIIGMLYKIVPFLAWLHLQNAGQGRLMAPPVNKILPDRPMERQMRLHFAAFLLLAAAVLWPEWLAWPAGAAFALANGWLARNLFAALGAYRRHGAEIIAKITA